MKCSTESSCQGNGNDYHFKRIFFPIFLCQRLCLLAELDKPNEFERSLGCDVYFICASQRALSDAKEKGSCLYVLVVPYRYIR